MAKMVSLWVSGNLKLLLFFLMLFKPTWLQLIKKYIFFYSARMH